MDADASMCERRLPALSAAPQTTDFDRQGYGLRWPDGNEREVRLHVPKPAPCALTFDKCLPFSRLTGQLQVSVATCTGKTGTRMRTRLILYTKATGHPLPVARYARGRSVQRSDRAPEGGRAGTGGTSGPDLPEGETRERRRTVRARLTSLR